jgi:hypothetical protein
MNQPDKPEAVLVASDKGVDTMPIGKTISCFSSFEKSKNQRK